MKRAPATAAAFAALAAASVGFTQLAPDGASHSLGGITPDSEYLIFVVDTSGSMKQFMWDRVQQQLQETLAAYPTLKGIQVLNDEGEYLLKSFRGNWILDTPSTRQEIVDGMRDWTDFSNSNPYEGIVKAIETFADPAKRISLYVYSDDFANGVVDAVLADVARANRVDATGGRRVRINAVAFPAVYEMTGQLLSAAAYATLMRELCQRNGGSFIALASR